MALTVPELGALLLVFFGIFYWLGIFAKTRAAFAFLGAVAVGTGGALGHLLSRVAAALQNAGGALTAWLFGGTIAGLLFIAAAVILIHDMHPKKGASRRTGWIALLLGASLATAATTIPALAPVASGVNSLLANVTTFLNSL
jgi:hypothetical protein